MGMQPLQSGMQHPASGCSIFLAQSSTKSIVAMIGIRLLHGGRIMNLASIDLNLLVTLNAVLTEKHLTRAGEQLGLSQPSMSHALGRLRRMFDHELLIRIGRE